MAYLSICKTENQDLICGRCGFNKMCDLFLRLYVHGEFVDMQVCKIGGYEINAHGRAFSNMEEKPTG